MWTRPERKSPSPEYWDEVYLDESKWRAPDKGTRQRCAEAIQLLGDVKGKTFLDLGGGPLLSKALLDKGAQWVTVVDCSEVGMKLAKEIEPRIHYSVCDAITYLLMEKYDPAPAPFDVTICMGLVCYMPPGSLQKICRWAPGTELVLNLPIAEGYLEYGTRVTVYSREDVHNATEDGGWCKVAEHKSKEHVFAKYKRS